MASSCFIRIKYNLVVKVSFPAVLCYCCVIRFRFSKESSKCLFLLILRELGFSVLGVVSLEFRGSFCAEILRFFLCCVLLVEWAICGRSRNLEVFQALGRISFGCSIKFPLPLSYVQPIRDKSNIHCFQTHIIVGLIWLFLLS